jgi:hypothetical protein
VSHEAPLLSGPVPSGERSTTRGLPHRGLNQVPARANAWGSTHRGRLSKRPFGPQLVPLASPRPHKKSDAGGSSDSGGRWMDQSTCTLAHQSGPPVSEGKMRKHNNWARFTEEPAQSMSEHCGAVGEDSGVLDQRAPVAKAAQLRPVSIATTSALQQSPHLLSDQDFFSSGGQALRPTGTAQSAPLGIPTVEPAKGSDSSGLGVNLNWRSTEAPGAVKDKQANLPWASTAAWQAPPVAACSSEGQPLQSDESAVDEYESVFSFL